MSCARSRPSCCGARGLAQSMRLLRVEHDDAVGNRLGRLAGSARSRARRSRCTAARIAHAPVDRREQRAPRAARLPAPCASSAPAAQRVSRCEVVQMARDDRAPRRAPATTSAQPGCRPSAHASERERRASDRPARRAPAGRHRRHAVMSRAAPPAGSRCRAPSRSALGAERLERDAQPADVHVDRALLDVDVVAPHLVEQLRCASARARAARAGSAAAGTRSGPIGTVALADRHAMRRRVELERARRRASPARPPARAGAAPT